MRARRRTPRWTPRDLRGVYSPRGVDAEGVMHTAPGGLHPAPAHGDSQRLASYARRMAAGSNDCTAEQWAAIALEATTVAQRLTEGP